MLKNELKRGFKSWRFVLVVLGGFIINLVNAIHGSTLLNFIFGSTYTTSQYALSRGYFDSSLSNGIYLYGGCSLSFLLPLIAAIPFADSYYEDRSSGFIKNIYIRENRISYLKARFLGNLIVSTSAVFLMYGLYFYVLLMVFPAIDPNPLYTSNAITEIGFFPQLYYFNAFLYNVVWISILSIFGGAFASIALASSSILKNRFVILLTPFIMIMLVDTVFDAFGPNISQISARAFLGNFFTGSEIMPIIVLLITFIFAYTLFIVKGRRNDVF